MKIIIGLGNPGIQYDLTRHNCGFVAVDKLAAKYNIEFVRKQNFQADIAKFKIADEDILIAKPQTYMNLSGNAVNALLSFYKVPLKNLLVAHDDVALPLGKIRMQQGGGAGGQHGVESILDQISYLLADDQTNAFDRLKIGIGPDPGGDRRAQYVLGKIPEGDLDLYNGVMDLCVEAISAWLEKGIEFSMNKFNGMNLLKPPASKPAHDAVNQSTKEDSD